MSICELEQNFTFFFFYFFFLAPTSKIYKNRKYKRGTASESGAPLSLVPENPSDVHKYDSAEIRRKSSSKRSKSVQNFRIQDHLKAHRDQAPPEGKPPRPPKNLQYYGRLENPGEENWIDYPTRDSKVKFQQANVKIFLFLPVSAACRT